MSGGGGSPKLPPKEQASRTAEPIQQLSPQAERNRRLAGSLLTRAFAQPTLSQPGLLGLFGRGVP